MDSRLVRRAGGALVIAAVALVAVWLVLVWVDAAPIGSVHTGDSDNLVAGARTAARCITDGHWQACGRIDGTRQSEVFPYPLLQYLPAIPLVWLGWSTPAILDTLARLNLVAFAGALALTALAARRCRPRGIGLLAPLALLCASATYQATSGFGEMLGATASLGAVVAVMYRRSALIVVAMALACLGKETMLPFVLVLGLVCGREPGDGWFPPARVTKAVGAGVALGLALTVGFNEFRYGTARNLAYLDPLFRTPGIARKVEFLAGVWVAPSSGLLWFWPVTVAVLFLGVVAALGAAIRNGRDLRGWVPAAAVFGTVVAFTMGLAAWLSPFGWIAYGPRLAVPLLPAATVAMLSAAGPGIAGLVRPVLRSMLGTVVVCAVVVLAGWAQFGAPWSYRESVADLLAPDATCASITQVVVQDDAARYYVCTSHVMWRRHPWTLASAFGDGGRTALAGRILLGGASVLLVLRMRRLLLEPTAAPDTVGDEPETDVDQPVAISPSG